MMNTITIILLISALICFSGIVIADNDINKKLVKGEKPRIWDIIVKYTCLLGFICNLLSAHMCSI